VTIPLLALGGAAATVSLAPTPQQVPVAAYAVPLVEAQSVLVARGDTPLWTSPSPDASRRGSVAAGARLPILALRSSAGCQGAWIAVGPLAWLCSDEATPSREPPSPEPAPAPNDGLPLNYFFVGEQGSLGYSSLERIEEVAPITRYEPGFALAMTRFAQPHNAQRYGLTQHGAWVPMRDLGAVRAPTPLGVALAPGEVPGWVVSKQAAVLASPGHHARRVASLARHEQVRVLEVVERDAKSWLRIAPDGWILDSEVARWRPASMPTEAAPGERWLDVDRAEQVLTAYEGTAPVFATPISAGRGADGSELATPQGIFRIWVKLRTSTMDNFDQPEAQDLYAIEAVPWVMFFDSGYGLHGAFWHNRFGEPRSHGCVNLTPADAQWIFGWTTPRLPPGWTAVLPTVYDPGTLVSVR
jgi:lipoprotein-anchoring transpeptidase ErfK/SrfK